MGCGNYMQFQNNDSLFFIGFYWLKRIKANVNGQKKKRKRRTYTLICFAANTTKNFITIIMSHKFDTT